MTPPRLRLYAIELIIHYFSCIWASKQYNKYNILLSYSWTTDAITLSSSAVGLSRHPLNTNCTQVGAKRAVQVR
jgi:hypothetical protein